MTENRAYGPHLILDGSGCPAGPLLSVECGYHFLEEFPSLIGMTPICLPTLGKFRDPNPLHEGISGFILVAESHICYHTWPEFGRVNIDVFSCKPFDAALAIRFCTEWFTIKEIHMRLINRGTDWADCLPSAMNLLIQQRSALGGACLT